MLGLVSHVFSLQSCKAERLTWQGKWADTLDSSIDKLSTASLTGSLRFIAFVSQGPDSLPCRRKRHAPQ
jgi:hypothetical protein